MTLPERIKEVHETRAAIAPYNFVPLPEVVVPAEPLPSHDCYYPSEGEQPRYTGRLECKLTTASPLYVRCGYTPEDYAAFGDKPFHELTPEQKQARSKFFHYTPNGDPIIPGSSLRGMLRALVEVAGYGKLERMNDRQLFYRSVQDEFYRAEFAGEDSPKAIAPNPRARQFYSKVRAGFLHKQNGRYLIQECIYARIEHNHTGRHLTSENNPAGERWKVAGIPPKRKAAYAPNGNRLDIYERIGTARYPHPNYQHQPIYVRIDATEMPYFFSANPRHRNQYLRFRAVKQASWVPEPGLDLATLVITGAMQNKHMEFVFLHTPIAEYPLDSSLVQRFEGDDQISHWQEKAFSKNSTRQKNGGLSSVEPVFFLLNSDGSVRFFGRAQLFRLPYGMSPAELVPEHIRRGHEKGQQESPIVDLADAMFGYIRGSNLCAGRIAVSDAVFLSAEKRLWYDDQKPYTEAILSAPKPTTFQHYLVQHPDQPAKKYAVQPDEEKTVIRGHKFYWHKSASPSIEQPKPELKTQITGFRAVSSGVRFEFRIYFENLSAVELGVLLWVLDKAADKQYRLKLGMAKPLGCGSISIESKLFISQRAERYRTLFEEQQPGWFSGESEEQDRSPYLNPFHSHVLATLKAYDSEKFQHCSKIDETLRIQCLLALLNWEDAPSGEQTRYMEIERDATNRNNVIPAARNQNPRSKRLPTGQYIDIINEYSSRPVLPSPIQVHTENKRSHGTEGVVEQLPEPVPGARTVQARVGGVGSNDANVTPLNGGRSGRARFAPNLPRRPSSDDLVMVQLDAEGNLDIIIAFL